MTVALPCFKFFHSFRCMRDRAGSSLAFGLCRFGLRLPLWTCLFLLPPNTQQSGNYRSLHTFALLSSAWNVLPPPRWHLHLILPCSSQRAPFL